MVSITIVISPYLRRHKMSSCPDGTTGECNTVANHIERVSDGKQKPTTCGGEERAACPLDTMPQCRQTEEAFVCVLSKFSKMVALFSGGTSQESELPIRVTVTRPEINPST